MRAPSDTILSASQELCVEAVIEISFYWNARQRSTMYKIILFDFTDDAIV